MDELAATKAFALSLIHFVAAFQLRRLHLFAILLLSSITEKTRVKKTPSYCFFEPAIWLCR
ncbi:murein transglycosylase [Vibrio jasicida]|jgi:membrane-bound lytic murein transglycosylase A|nr:murein transglycosylase [Vibrio jasicida]PAW12237.1 murein transglycosylase [Vibrio sp. V1B]PQJ58836.1 murein transglycosylase [Vibrio jasicida]